MAKSIQDYKNDYNAAKSRGDAAGMQAANSGANSIRQNQGQAAQYATNDIIKTAQSQYNSSRGSGNASGMQSANNAANAARQSAGQSAQYADRDIERVQNSYNGSYSGGTQSGGTPTGGSPWTGSTNGLTMQGLSTPGIVTGGVVGTQYNIPKVNIPTIVPPAVPQGNGGQVGSLRTQTINGQRLVYDKNGYVYAAGTDANRGGYTPDMVNSGQLKAIGKLSDYVNQNYLQTLNNMRITDPYAKLSGGLANVGENDRALAYTRAGSQYFTTDYGRGIQQSKEDFDEAQRRGDTQGMNQAHYYAEILRQMAGYSGGPDGSGHISAGLQPGTEQYLIPGMGDPNQRDKLYAEAMGAMKNGGIYGNGLQNQRGGGVQGMDEAALASFLWGHDLQQQVSGTYQKNGNTYYTLREPDQYGNQQYVNPTNGRQFISVVGQDGRGQLVQMGQRDPMVGLSGLYSQAAQNAAPQSTAAPAVAQDTQSSMGTMPARFRSSADNVMVNNGEQAAIKDKMNQNSAAWHSASDQEKARLEAENRQLAGLLGGNVSFHPGSGTWSGSADAGYQETPEYNQGGSAAMGGNATLGGGYPQQGDNGLGRYEQLLQQQQTQYDQIAAQQEAAQRAAVEQAVGQLSGQKGDFDGYYNNLYRQLYIDRRMQEKNLPQQLAAMGATGGLTESSALALQTSYTDALRQGEQSKIGALSDIDQAIANAKFSGDISMAEQGAQLAREKLQSYGDVISAMQQQQNWQNEFYYKMAQDSLSQQNWKTQFNAEQQWRDKEWNYSTGQDQYNRQKESALAMAEYGNFSALAKLWGLSEAEVQAMTSSYAAQNQMSQEQAARDLADWHAQYGDLSKVIGLGVNVNLGTPSGRSGGGRVYQTGYEQSEYDSGGTGNVWEGINTNDVIALGYGPISREQLEQLVEKGEVIAKEDPATGIIRLSKKVNMPGLFDQMNLGSLLF